MKAAIAKTVKHILLWLGSVFIRDTSPKHVFYHDVGNAYTPMGTTADLFWAHIKELRKGDVVCFDDGFRGIWDMREEFKTRGISPLVFIAIRLVGLPGYLTWDEFRTLKKDYGFKFQNHTWSHQTLAGFMIDESPIEDRTEEWYKRELVESKARIEKELDEPCEELCFPVGLFSDDVLRRCKEAGYKKVYASYPGKATEWNGLQIQPRCLCQFLSPFDFKMVLKGGMNIFAAHYRKRHYIAEAAK